MTLSPWLFRQTILASVAISLVALVFDLAFPGLIPDDIRKADQGATADDELGRMLVIGVIWLIDVVATIAATVGLYRFRPWARQWNLYVVALSLPLCALLGHMVLSGLAYGLYMVAAMLWGGVTFATYFSDLSSRFDIPSVHNSPAP